MGDEYPNNSMKKQGIPHQSYLSDDLIIEEILTRLPVKSVLRFKSVSKQWENKWRKIEFGHDNVILPNKGAVLINEKLYWDARNPRDGTIIIVTFDLGVERFDLIKVDSDEMDFLGFMGGSLIKCNHDTFIGDNFDKLLHILKPPAIVKSIGLPQGLRLDLRSEMIGFTRTGKFFVTGTCNDEPRADVQRRTLGIVDTCTKPVQYTMLLRLDGFLWIAKYVPSLVSPFANEEPSEA